MKKHKEKVNANELRCLNDITVAMLRFWESLPPMEQQKMTIEYLVMLKFIEKKLAPKMVFPKNQTTIGFSEVEVLAWYRFIAMVELIGLDPFAFSFLNNLKRNLEKIITTTPIPRYST